MNLDIKNMDTAIGELRKVANTLEGHINYSYIEAMGNVIIEWDSCTRPLLEGLIIDTEAK